MEGWTDLISIFGFSPLQLITLSYAGNYENGLMSNFRLVESRPIEYFNDVPFYHSQSFIEGFTTRFQVQLTTENINKTNLVLKQSNFTLQNSNLYINQILTPIFFSFYLLTYHLC
jgi:hypothetical protein